MNILITNDDGRDSFGLALLREAAARRFKEGRIVTITTKEYSSGVGMSVANRPTFDTVNYPLEKLGENYYALDGTPADVIYAAGCWPEKFLPVGTFDLVLSGVNDGANVGLDVIHSGTVGAAMMASAIFGMTAYALSQQFPVGNSADGRFSKESKEALFEVASLHLQNFLTDLQLGTGECFNVNFPAQKPRGLVHVKTAPYSRWREIPNIPMNARDRLNFDIERLNDGFITVAELDLQVNPSLRY